MRGNKFLAASWVKVSGMRRAFKVASFYDQPSLFPSVLRGSGPVDS